MNALRAGFIAIAIGLGCASGANAADGRIVQAEGDVWVTSSAGIQRRADGANHAVFPRETISTGANARAVVELPNARFVLTANSSLAIKEEDWFQQLRGRVFFAFARLFGGESRERRVETATTTIGVRGTRFLVGIGEDGQAVAVDAGAVRLDANEGELAIYRARDTQAEFDQFRRQHAEGMDQMRKEFEQYRQQVQAEFVAYAKGLDLGAGQMVTINGRDATQGPVADQLRQEMEQLRALAGDPARP